MQVALYLKHFPSAGAPLNDGTSIAVGGLASGLAQNGARVSVLCEGRERSSVATGSGYTVECFPNRHPFRTFALAPDLKRYVADRLARRRGVCLVNGMFHPPVYAMARWLRRQGVPYVVAPHDPYDQAVFSRNAHLKWPYWYLFERRLLRRAAAVQVLDARHGDCLKGLGIGTRVIQTFNGVASGTAPPESQLKWNEADRPVRLVFLGRLDAWNKGLDVLIEAFPRFAERADARLTIQGPDWGDRARLEARAARATAAGRIAFLGPDYERASPWILSGHDVFCLPSRFEGFGLAALEAMLAARVLLVSQSAGIAPHVLAADCGVVVKPTAASVEEGLLALLQRRQSWREMGLRGRRYALARLQWKSIAADALRQYKSLATAA